MAKRDSLTAFKAKAGFTIVEVMFVLAVAGLILSLVFMALPALQRSGHNNTRKQDVVAILDAVSHWELNNSGTFPDCGPPPYGPSPLHATSCTGAGNLLEFARLHHYDPISDPTQVNITSQGVSRPSQGPVTNIDAVTIYNHFRCDTANPGKASSSGAGYRDVVALYAIETANGSAGQCQQL